MSVTQFLYKMKWVFYMSNTTVQDIRQPEGKEIQQIKAIKEYPPLMESDG